MRKSNEQPLKEVIDKLLEVYKLKDKLSEVRLIGSWEKVMGKVIAVRTRELYIKDKKLFVSLNSPPLREELSYAKEKIKNMLNHEAGELVIDEVILIG
jgi:predicted nucleic acid-binding Zn ribbon protein